MTTASYYLRSPGDPAWKLTPSQETAFTWEYDDGRAELLALYEKGKRQQWNAQSRIDWSQDLHPDNPMEMPDETISIYGSDVWNKLTARERANLRRHLQAWQISQFLHGEQGALICTAKIVQQVQNIDAKFYAATQVIDEARHVETYSRLLHEKFDIAYPINAQLKTLLEDVIQRKEWDYTYLGMQVVIEGLALSAFQGIRDRSQNPLAAQVNAYVMQDEARHVAFGRLALREYYPQLSEAERAQREEFLVEACYLMRDRMTPADVWETIGLDMAACHAFNEASEPTRKFHSRLFSRIVPTVRDIGLWGPRVRQAYEQMGVMRFADVDGAAVLEQDNRAAEEFDARAMVKAALSGD